MNFFKSILLLVTFAFATSVKADMYIALDYGPSELDSYLGFEDDDTATKLAFGWENNGLVLEGYYIDFGTPGISADFGFGTISYTDEITGFGFDAGFESRGDLKFFGKAGLLLWDLDEKLSGFTVYSDSGVGLKFGFGGSYRPSKEFAIRLSYEKYLIEDEFDDQHDQTMTSAGIMFFF